MVVKTRSGEATGSYPERDHYEDKHRHYHRSYSDSDSGDCEDREGEGG